LFLHRIIHRRQRAERKGAFRVILRPQPKNLRASSGLESFGCGLRMTINGVASLAGMFSIPEHLCLLRNCAYTLSPSFRNPQFLARQARFSYIISWSDKETLMKKILPVFALLIFAAMFILGVSVGLDAVLRNSKAT
jgi:hypothetical protein